jgi:LPPG:FO 2-phospho-L-lactate transferase
MVETSAREMPFQEYLVKRRAQDAVTGVRFEGIEEAQPAPGVLDAIHAAEAILIAPSNPIASIGPILGVRDIGEAVAVSTAKRAAVSPIIGGASLQPPAGEMMSGLGHRVDAAGVASIYRGYVDAMFIDDADAVLASAIEEMGIRPVVTATIMRDDASSRRLGEHVIAELGLDASSS